MTRARLQSASDHLCECGFTRAVHAQKTDTIIYIEAQIEISQDGRIIAIANIYILQRFRLY